MPVLGIDPGRGKFGVAVVDENKTILFRKIVRFSASGKAAGDATGFAEALRGAVSGAADGFAISAIALGDGTLSGEFMAELKKLSAIDRRVGAAKVALVDERATTEAARALHLELSPPKFPLSLLPKSLIPVTAEVDDLAAAAIAIKYIESVEKTK